MNDLFLRKVELSNFRVYGNSYTFDLPPSPGVTLIVGANGLGKTTFFDGVEWALTNEVSRFADIPTDGRRRERDPLTRLGVPEGSHRVSLQFTDGAPIDRGRGVAPADGVVANLLRKPQWPEIGDLHRYLSITHFLGQASSQRFSVRKPKDQWEALKGPAGVDRINYIKDRIGGQAARQAFTRAIREATERVATAEADLASWQELVGDRDRLEQLSVSDEAVPASAVAVAANEIGARFAQIAPDVRWNVATSAESVESILSRLSALGAVVAGRSQSELARLQTLEALVADYEKSTADMLATTMLVQESEARQTKTESALADADQTATVAAAALATAQRVAGEAHSRVGTVARATAAAAQLNTVIGDVRNLDVAIVATEHATKMAEDRQSELNGLVATTLASINRRRLIADQLAQARVRRDLVDRLIAIQVEIDRIATAASEEKAAGLRQQRLALLRQKEIAVVEVTRINSELRRMDERQAAIAEAVATLAARMSADDTECPVCATRFAVGELVAISQTRPEGRMQAVSGLATVLAAQQLQIEKINEQLREVERLLAEQNEQLIVLTALRAESAELRQQLLEAGAVPDAQLSPAAEAARVADLELRAQALDETADAGVALEELETRLNAVRADIQAEAARLVGLTRSRTDALAKIEMARAVLQQTPEFWNTSNGIIVDIAAVEAVATQHSVQAAVALAIAQAHAEEARLKRDTLRQQLATDTAALGTANARLNDLVRRRQTMTSTWLASGMSGEPDDARLEAHRLGARNRASQITILTERQRRTTAGYRTWLQDEALRERRDRVAQRMIALQADSETSVATVLISVVTAAQDDLKNAQEARGRMDALVSQMQTQADIYAERVLQPLNQTIQRFGRALMTWSDASIIYRAEHYATRSELRPSAVRTDSQGRILPLEINPNMFFSEGQLSALSVSALFAASTTFQWSRWRCLLMDDPLQHNDVIHASAFLDLVRQLVRRLGYQIVMSTHDSAEAAFLARKCQSANIPFAVQELTPRGDDGLVSEAA
jgi:DNA repair exonuclease SbcCD ATPase subunit